MTTTVMLAGVGGQGTILAGDVLAKVAVADGHDVTLSEVHGMAQRGGSVDTVVRFGDEVYSPVVDPGAVDVLCAFELLEGARRAHWVRKDGRILVSTRRIAPMSVLIGADEYPEGLERALEARGATLLDAETLACRASSPRSSNVVMLGALSAGLPFDEGTWRDVIATRVPKHTVEANLEAFMLGREACQQ